MFHPATRLFSSSVRLSRLVFFSRPFVKLIQVPCKHEFEGNVFAHDVLLWQPLHLPVQLKLKSRVAGDPLCANGLLQLVEYLIA